MQTAPYHQLVLSSLRAASLLMLAACGTANAQSARPWEKMRAEQIAAARREGIPVSLDELRGKTIPADRNAATYLAQLDALDKTSAVTSADYDSLEHLSSSTVTPDQIAAARKAFEMHLDRYRLIRLAAECAGYREKQTTLSVGGVTLPDRFRSMARFRDCGRWLCYKALLLTAEGWPLEGVKEAQLAFETARLATSNGPLIAYLVGKAIEPMGLKTLRVIMERSNGGAEVAAAVENAINTRPATHLSATMRCEVASYLSMSASERQAAGSDPNTAKDPDYLRAVREYHYPKDPKLAMPRMFDMNDAHYIAWMRRIIPFADLPYPQALAGIRTIEAETKPVEKDPDYQLAADSIGTMEKLPAISARNIAYAEAVCATAAVLIWKAKHGNLPDTLADAVTFTDPFDLKPLRYRIEGSGFVIYSVGETGNFDGGKPDVRTPVTNVAVWWK